jgi:hypothetical protein
MKTMAECARESTGRRAGHIALTHLLLLFLLSGCRGGSDSHSPENGDGPQETVALTLQGAYQPPDASEAEQALILELRRDIQRVQSKKATAFAPWIGHEKELAQLIFSDDPRTFLSWQVVRHTMFHHPKPVEFETLKASPRWETWQRALQEDSIGGPDPYPPFPSTSGNLVHHAYSLEILLRSTPLDVSSLSGVFEFGGGYGSFCRMLYRYGYAGHYVLFDLPAVAMLQKYYLNSTGLPLRVTTELADGAGTVSILTEDEVLSAGDRIADIELFVGLWSVSEVPVALRDEILTLLENTRFFLIGYQTDFGGTDNREYFAAFQQTKPDLEWLDFPIDHLPGSRYLLGFPKQP